MKPHSTENEYRNRLQEFLKFLHRPPERQEILLGTNGQLPISTIEMRLDELYFGLWEAAAFEYAVHGNEVAATIELRVFHPVAKTWICRTGMAAVPYTAQNPMEQALPQLHALCLASAARTLGKAFGRDLERDYEEAYKPLVTHKVV